MTDKQTLKLALEALEFNDRRFSIDNYPSSGTVRGVGEKAITAIKQALAAPVQPVAAEGKFDSDPHWMRCEIAHHNLVQSNPHEWPGGYKTRLLYTTPPAQPEPVQSAERGETVATISITQHKSFRTIDNHFEDCVRDWPEGEYKLVLATPPAQPAPVQEPGPSGDYLSDFQEGQWWLAELDAAVANGTHDQKRAVAVVRNLLATVAANTTPPAQEFTCSTGLCHYKAQPAPVQEPVAYWIPKAKQFCIADPSGRPFAKAWEPLYTTPPAQQAPNCTRSHPHESMDAMCELRTEIARLTNENARLKAQQAAVQEPVAELLKQSRANFDRNFGKGGQGWADWIYSDLLELLNTTSPAPQRTWIGLTDDEILKMAYPIRWQEVDDFEADKAVNFAQMVEAKLKEKNND